MFDFAKPNLFTGNFHFCSDLQRREFGLGWGGYGLGCGWFRKLCALKDVKELNFWPQIEQLHVAFF